MIKAPTFWNIRFYFKFVGLNLPIFSSNAKCLVFEKFGLASKYI
jgi:hypothetical protein